MKQLLSFVLSLCFLSGGFIFSQTSSISDADVAIRFYNRSVYYPGNSPAENILVQLTITNKQAQTLRFKLADDRLFSVDFIAFNSKNIKLEHTNDWKKKQTTSRQIFFREVSLEPGESFSFIENIKDYIIINDPGMYILEGSFYPELIRDENIQNKSNRLILEIKPSPGPAAVRTLPVAAMSGEILRAESISPDQVVSTILTARQKALWDQFFIYFDMDKMIKRDPTLNRRYNNESETGRLTMIENYKTDLKQARIDRDISTIPTSFDIERTSYTATEATVVVIQRFKNNNYTEIKRFTYNLWSRNNVWLIYNYSVENLGNE